MTARYTRQMIRQFFRYALRAGAVRSQDMAGTPAKGVIFTICK